MLSRLKLNSSLWRAAKEVQPLVWITARKLRYSPSLQTDPPRVRNQRLPNRQPHHAHPPASPARASCGPATRLRSFNRSQREQRPPSPALQPGPSSSSKGWERFWCEVVQQNITSSGSCWARGSANLLPPSPQQSGPSQTPPQAVLCTTKQPWCPLKELYFQGAGEGAVCGRIVCDSGKAPSRNSARGRS